MILIMRFDQRVVSQHQDTDEIITYKTIYILE